MRNFFAAGAAILFTCVAYSNDRPENVEWPSYGSDNASTKYSALAQIDAKNFSGLRVAWTWRSPDEALIRDHPDDRLMRRARFKATPLMVGGALYVSTGLGQIASIDAATGETRWVFDPESYVSGAPASAVGFLTRGVAYDKKTGEKVAEAALPGEAIGTPMTYMLNGTQFIALAVRGEGLGGDLVALALP